MFEEKSSATEAEVIATSRYMPKTHEVIMRDLPIPEGIRYYRRSEKPSRALRFLFSFVGIVLAAMLFSLSYSTLSDEFHVVKPVPQDAQVATPETKEGTIEVKSYPYSYEAAKGSSIWKLSTRAVNDYIHDNPVQYDPQIKHLWVYYLADIYPERSIANKGVYEFSQELIEEAYSYAIQDNSNRN